MNEFQLPKFKLILRPEVKVRDYEVRYIYAGRKLKICGHCECTIPIGASSTTFLKRTSVGSKQTYENTYSCGLKGGSCTREIANKLSVKLP